MEDIYKFYVDAETYDRIVAGKKTIHLVINAPKCKTYAAGNQITFEKKPEADSDLNISPATVKAEIDNLYYFTDIREAVETLGKEKCGFKQSQTFEKGEDKFLSTEKYEKVEKNGLLAISFKLI